MMPVRVARQRFLLHKAVIQCFSRAGCHPASAGDSLASFLPITLDAMAVISLEALQKSPDSNVRFCLAATKAPLAEEVHEKHDFHAV
ncbi:MAG: hypothetical protein CBD74_08735 [Saprospirales bacterium TMED214]|nr:MAG: hypothetical protein CBD74_08735 [Saprospirales bacterium TMED214]